MNNIVCLEHISKSFDDIKVLDDFSLDIEPNSFTVITGASGSGKSTLLNMIGLLDKPDHGDITLFDEKNIKPFSRKAEIMLRDKIGYLFQNFALIENESVKYNLKIAINNKNITNKSKLIEDALNEVGLDGYANKKIFKCSGGEQQRIAIARLLLKPCELVLADEPTGSLDHENKMIVIHLLKKLQSMGKTIIVVTHDDELIGIGDQVIHLRKN